MRNPPISVPVGVRLVPVAGDEALDRPILVCEGPCGSTWQPHRRVTVASVELGTKLAGGVGAEVGEISPRYACEGCQTRRRWGV